MKRLGLLLGLLGSLAAAAPAGAFEPSLASDFEPPMRSLFNLDYAKALEQAGDVIQKRPESPFGYLFEAGLIWWQASTEYGLFKDTPTLENRFEEDARKAVELSKASFDAEEASARADAYFTAGMALGLIGQWDLARGRWLKAYFNGKKAVKYLKKCIRIDSDYHDAYLGLGIFDYQAAKLPGVLKLSALLMVRGDAERGLSRIRRAMEKGRFVRHQAAIFLLSLYAVQEHDAPAAFYLLRQLRADFPESPYFQFREIVLRHGMGDWEGSHREALELFKRRLQDPAILGRKQLSLFCGMLGPDCLGAKDAEALSDWTRKALAGESGDASWKSLLNLYLGFSLDLQGRRDAALAAYQESLAEGLEPMAGYAKRCMAKACDKTETVNILKEISKRNG